MHLEHCLCDSIPNIDIKTRVVLVMHHREAHKTTNTGQLANIVLNDCEIHLRGLRDHPVDLSGLASPNRRPLLLFQREDAQMITPELVAADPRPITLVVPDGTWAQVRRTIRREPALVAIEAITVPPLPPSRYRLRRQSHHGDLATFEAIARALGVIEGPTVQSQMEHLFQLMVDRTMQTRGHHRPRR